VRGCDLGFNGQGLGRSEGSGIKGIGVRGKGLKLQELGSRP